MSPRSAITATSWNPIDDPVDRALIQGRLTPGICEIINADSPRRLEEREGYGLSGSIIWFRGVKLSHFEIQFHLYTREHWQEWEAFRPLVYKPPYGKRARALDIWHPITQQVGIRSIMIENFVAPQQVDDGVWTVRLQVVEWRKLKWALSKPTGSADQPIDPVDEQIKENRKTIKELGEEEQALDDARRR